MICEDRCRHTRKWDDSVYLSGRYADGECLCWDAFTFEDDPAKVLKLPKRLKAPRERGYSE